MKCEDEAERLQTYDVQKGETSVSGISSGGYFATQIQVAFSSIIKGAGIIAAGPFNCGADHVMMYCMQLKWPYITGVDNAIKWSGTERLDSVENLKKHRVYILSGNKDTTVITPVVDQLYDFYKNFMNETNIIYNTEMNITHTFPTDFDSKLNSPCLISRSPYISNCGFDFVEAAFKHIYDDIGNKTVTPTGDWIHFNQTEFAENENPHDIGLSKDGFLYVPKYCQQNFTKEEEKCRLHVAFHGCEQNFVMVGEKFLLHTGYDRWADLNRMIVMFPQTFSDITFHFTPTNGFLNNLNGCWDWLGWYGDHFQSKNGKQMSTIKKMLDRILGDEKKS